jgi:hypothetical protein
VKNPGYRDFFFLEENPGCRDFLVFFLEENFSGTARPIKTLSGILTGGDYGILGRGGEFAVLSCREKKIGPFYTLKQEGT